MRKLEDLLSTNTSSRPQREGLAGLFDVLAGWISPSLWLEYHGLVEVFLVMGDRPGADVKLGLCGVSPAESIRHFC
jgi:hypothetical protein